MERVEELCCYYVALVRSIYLVHQNHHWITKGSNFYGNHLLFERIYKTAADDADLAAEKFIGLFGTDVIDLHMQAQMIGKITESFASGNPLDTSLKIEKKFLDFSEKFYNIVKEEGKMTLGLDDMIMVIASNREAAVYLLKQAASQDMGVGDMNSKVVARMNLLRRVKKAQAGDVDLKSKLLTLWTSIVPSYVVGKYEAKDLTVNIDMNVQPPRIFANAKLPTAVAPEVLQKIEDNFKRTAMAMLPPNMQGSMIAVGFSTPPAKPMPTMPSKF